MTVIAWDGKTLAADKRMVSAGLILTTTKIRRIGGLLVGAAGNISSTAELMAWVERGRNPVDWPASQKDKEDWAGLLVIEGRRILRYEQSPFPCELEDRVVATGSGRDFAIAAMHCGKTAREAVELACLLENGCGNGVDVLELSSD